MGEAQRTPSRFVRAGWAFLFFGSSFPKCREGGTLLPVGLCIFAKDRLSLNFPVYSREDIVLPVLRQKKISISRPIHLKKENKKVYFLLNMVYAIRVGDTLPGSPRLILTGTSPDSLE